MINLNFSNVEDLVFFDSAAQRALPDHYFSIFEQWRLAKRMPYLREMGKQAVLDLLNSITEDDVALLEVYFGQKIVVEKLNYSIAESREALLSDACDALCESVGFGNFSTWRDDERLYIVTWR